MPKTQKMVIDAFLLSTQHYNVRIKDKWSNPENGVAPYPTPRCSSYWKGSFQVTLDYGRQFYLLINYYHRQLGHFYHLITATDLNWLQRSTSHSLCLESEVDTISIQKLGHWDFYMTVILKETQTHTICGIFALS